MLTEDGYIAEGIVSNVFFIKHSVCYTPSLDTGILPGITRAFVIDRARSAGLSIKEGLFMWDDLALADEVFFVNSIQEIVPVTRLFMPDGRSMPVAAGVTREHTRRLMQMYQHYTGSGI
jgi:4-amino-4-deoxychorismate lyase